MTSTTMATMTEAAAESECSCTNPPPPETTIQKSKKQKPFQSSHQLNKALKKIETLEQKIVKYRAEISKLKEDVKVAKRANGRLNKIPKP